jgi:hypothetical protein
MWTHPDFLILYAAGTTARPGDVGNPGTAKDIVSVGATENGRSEHGGDGAVLEPRARPAERTPGGNRRIAPTIGAPGDGSRPPSTRAPAASRTSAARAWRRRRRRASRCSCASTCGTATTRTARRRRERTAGAAAERGAAQGAPDEQRLAHDRPLHGQRLGRLVALERAGMGTHHCRRRALLPGRSRDSGCTTSTACRHDGAGASGESRTFTVQVGNGAPSRRSRSRSRSSGPTIPARCSTAAARQRL